MTGDDQARLAVKMATGLACVGLEAVKHKQGNPPEWLPVDMATVIGVLASCKIIVREVTPETPTMQRPRLMK